MDKIQLGKEIKARRKEIGLSQKECCAGICSQPLLSHIEAGDYMPAADILLGIFQRLGISENRFTLESYFPISQENRFNQQCEDLCRSHAYADLLSFLLQDDVVDAVTDEELQAYYYYLAIAQYQTADYTAAKQNFNLALAEAESKKLSSVSRLSLAGLGVLAARKQQKQSAQVYFQQAFADLREGRYDYEENLNALFYLKAWGQKELEDSLSALATLESGIRFISEHNSHYMLANFYYLAAQLAIQEPQKNSQKLLENSQLFEELYQEKIFK